MPTKLLEGYQRFLSEYYCQHKDALLRLAKEQTPSIAIISCCDARVDPTIIFDVVPGDLFVVRNVANLVPPFESERSFHGTSAALEFAVTRLKVSHIVILGHADCGGIKALLSDDQTHPTDFLDTWMSIARQAKEQVLQQEPLITNQKEMEQACEKAAILLSKDNLMTFPWIRDRVHHGHLTLHAWYYDLRDGSLAILSDADMKRTT